jgi:hypothetical protein
MSPASDSVESTSSVPLSLYMRMYYSHVECKLKMNKDIFEDGDGLIIDKFPLLS